MDLQKLREFIDSEDGQKSIIEFSEKFNKEQKIKSSQIERLHKSGKFIEILEKSISKYDNDNYRDFWYSKGMYPPENMLWFLLDYAEIYGRECDKKEWEEHANMFTSQLIFCNGYYFNIMDGQGSIIKISKQVL